MAAMAAKINDLILLRMSLVVKLGIELDDKGQILHREEILKLMSWALALLSLEIHVPVVTNLSFVSHWY